MLKKIVQCIITRAFYIQKPMYCLKTKQYVYLVQWEFLKIFHFKRQYLTKEELLQKGVPEQYIKVKN